VQFGILTPSTHQTPPLDTVAVITLLSFFSFLYGGTLGTAATTGLLYQPRMRGDGDSGEIGGMKISRGNRSTRRKPAPAPLCPPQIPHDQTRFWTRAAAVGSQRLTAWAMARPTLLSSSFYVRPPFIFFVCICIYVTFAVFSRKVSRYLKS
jgi:hypothetical protein